MGDTSEGLLYVLWGGATTEEYDYLFRISADEVVEMSYHDDFNDIQDLPNSETIADKLPTFSKIVSSLQYAE
jgi:hypothetical protein